MFAFLKLVYKNRDVEMLLDGRTTTPADSSMCVLFSCLSPKGINAANARQPDHVREDSQLLCHQRGTQTDLQHVPQDQADCCGAQPGHESNLRLYTDSLQEARHPHV